MQNQIGIEDPWLERELVCPRDKGDLRRGGDHLMCDQSHRYPIVDGIPIMLIDDVPQTAPDVTRRSLAAATTNDTYVPRRNASGGVDSYVQRAIVGTNGNLYGRVAGRLPRYPIPELRLPAAREDSRDLLDIGCNWGRWSVAAAYKGYRPVGMDPGLESVIPARRIARQLGVEARFIVGDARYLPFRAGRFDVVYSYGVLQHFSPVDAKLAIAETSRVVMPSGTVLIQMAARFGLRSMLQQARRRFREPRGFEVRYWKPSEIADAFRSLIGPTTLSVDGYLTLNPQPSDLDLLPFASRQIVRGSEVLRALSSRFPALLEIADSIYATSVKESRVDTARRKSTRSE